MSESPLATASEVAEYLRTTTTKLANDRYRGVGPKFVKHGRRVLYRWADVYAWTEANTLQRTDDRPGAA
ncbi:DNA-binding protein [Rhodococcus sp. (in: high G+C Gram-positive bacteria)]|uniref:helix-turn-helix transcriptional regulator n=1 Tax=Rhodococcus sp. TaxID=1831 RepID=UPI0025831018|nr:DNA-binding protein [Rhodococcus sp. (in: high G+C Gram-positive bacteria)]